MSGDLEKTGTDSIIDLLLSHSNRKLQEFLKSKNLAFSGDSSKLKERLVSNYDLGKISDNELTILLDELEEYGNQQIYLYKVPNAVLNQLRDEDFVINVLEKNNLSDLYNSYHPLSLPETPEIIYIVYDEDWLKIRWGVKKEDLGIPLDKKITEDGREYLLRKYLITKIRDITLFQVSLITGEAELLIHKSADADYDQEQNEYLNQIYNIFGWDPLDPIELNHAIGNIDNSGEVNTRKRGVKTPKGSDITVGSPSKDVSINEDEDADNATNVPMGMRTLGHFYWLPEKSDSKLENKLYTRMYSNRFAIYGERSEEEVNHVIKRIRHHIG